MLNFDNISFIRNAIIKEAQLNESYSYSRMSGTIQIDLSMGYLNIVEIQEDLESETETENLKDELWDLKNHCDDLEDEISNLKFELKDITKKYNELNGGNNND